MCLLVNHPKHLQRLLHRHNLRNVVVLANQRLPLLMILTRRR